MSSPITMIDPAHAAVHLPRVDMVDNPITGRTEWQIDRDDARFDWSVGIDGDRQLWFELHGRTVELTPLMLEELASALVAVAAEKRVQDAEARR